VKFGGDQVAIEGLTAEIDRMTMEGRVAYAWGRGDRPPRIEASLTAPDIDFDRASALAQGVFAGTPFELPREGSISLKLGPGCACWRRGPPRRHRRCSSSRACLISSGS